MEIWSEKYKNMGKNSINKAISQVKEFNRIASKITIEQLTRQLESYGFKDVSYLRLESQSCLFQINTEKTKLLVNLSFFPHIEISDGRPTINHIYWEGEYTEKFPATLLLYFDNLTFQYVSIGNENLGGKT